MKRLKRIGMLVALYISKAGLWLSLLAMWLSKQCRDKEAEAAFLRQLEQALREQQKTQSTVVHLKDFKGWS